MTAVSGCRKENHWGRHLSNASRAGFSLTGNASRAGFSLTGNVRQPGSASRVMSDSRVQPHELMNTLTFRLLLARQGPTGSIHSYGEKASLKAFTGI